MFPSRIQYIISNYQIWGIVPLDKFLHFLLGAIITIILRIFNIKLRNIFFILVVIGLTKEIIDSYTINNTLSEHIKDFSITFLYPLMITIVHILKRKY